MDPDATLAVIAGLLRNGELGEGTNDGEDLDIACQDLYDWLHGQGFAPDWSQHDLATSYYLCRAVHHDRGERV